MAMSKLLNGVDSLGIWDHRDAIPEYEYTPLPLGFIRLLVLFPGQSSTEDIFCELIDYKVDSMEPAIYEALSWAWGADQWTSNIQIRKGGQYFRLRVPESLSSALKVLRYRAAERIIWVDAICINQTSTYEKSIQVPLMSTIYGVASTVCIWLGNSDKYTADAIDFMKNEILKLHNFDELCESTKVIPKWSAMLQLMQRPWFSRRWVVQEIALSQSALVHCGDYQIRWHDFASAVQLVVEAESTSQAVSNSMKRIGITRHVQNQIESVHALGASLLVDATRNMFKQSTDKRLQPVFGIEYLVSRMQAFDVSEPKDAVYALLALAKDTLPIHSASAMGDTLWAFTQRTPFLIDYSQTYAEVCVQFMSHCIRQSEPTQALNILCRPWAPLPKRQEAVATGQYILPSWISSLSDAAFSMFQYPNSLSRMSRSNADTLVGLPGDRIRYSAAGATSVIFRSLEFRTTANYSSMMLSGFVLDVVGDVDLPSQNGYVPEDWLRRGNWDDLSQEPPDEFWRTLIADRSMDGGFAPAYGARAVHLSVIRTRSGGHLNTMELVNSPSFIISQFFKRVQGVIWNKSLMRSEKGGLGLVRTDVQKGDLICIIYGCNVPVVLRRHGKTSMQTRREELEILHVIEERKQKAVSYIQRMWRTKQQRKKKSLTESAASHDSTAPRIHPQLRWDGIGDSFMSR
jgi:hypothetical protein